ncbi:hypothetical protein AB0L13_44925 [Saccharopolyspora shandongensis]
MTFREGPQGRLGGIDVGKRIHHACLVDETGKIVFNQKAVSGQAGIGV